MLAVEDSTDAIFNKGQQRRGIGKLIPEYKSVEVCKIEEALLESFEKNLDASKSVYPEVSNTAQLDDTLFLVAWPPGSRVASLLASHPLCGSIPHQAYKLRREPTDGFGFRVGVVTLMLLSLSLYRYI